MKTNVERVLEEVGKVEKCLAKKWKDRVKMWRVMKVNKCLDKNRKVKDEF